MKAYFKKKEEEQTEGWIIIWGDMLSVVLTFFILLFGVSQVDTGKYSEITASLMDSFGGSDMEQGIQTSGLNKDLVDMNILVKKIKDAIAEQNLEDGLEISLDHRGAVLHAPGEVFFKSGEAEILDQGKVFLTKLSGLLKQVPYKILVEGHSDDVPINTPRFPSNWELSTGRASSVVRFLIEEAEIPPERLAAAGYSKYKPRFAPTPENRSRNRRVEIIMLREK